MGKSDLKRPHDDGDDGDAKLSRKSASADVASAKSARKASGEPLKGQDVDGNIYWELSKMRRVGISHFKNTTLVNIREYYESAGQMRPGKKGISLSLDQFKMLVKAIPHITAELQKDGVDVGDMGDVAGQEVAGPSDTKKEKKTKKASDKSNIEATSDEESS